MKKLLIGPAGSGKTHQLLDEFEETLRTSENLLEDSFHFLLPSAEHTERIISLTLQRGIKGFFKSRVTTLSSLIHDTFSVGHDGVATNVTRYLLIRQILESRDWPYFSEVQQTGGFLNLILSFMTELKESRISVPAFRERINALKQVEPDVAVKYEALAGIYETYEAGLKAKGLRDRQDAFDLYLERKNAQQHQVPLPKVPGSESQNEPGTFGRGTTAKRFRKIWLDGFFDFSALQLAYLKELVEQTEEMTITLTLDPDPKRADLFETVLKTKTVLESLGFETEVLERRGEACLAHESPGSTSGAPTLNHIEQNLFCADRLGDRHQAQTGKEPVPKSKPKADTSVAVFEAIGMEGEVEMIARTILHMAKRGEHKLSDFAILLRMVGDYESVIRSVFSRYGLPVEIHERERLGFAPLMGVIVSLLKIFKDDWKRADLMEFLKSTYVHTLNGEEKDYEWVSQLEHASMKEHVFKSREKWVSLDPRLEELAALEDGLKTAKTYSSIRGTLFRAVERMFNFDSFTRRDSVSFKRFEAILEEIERSFAAQASGAVYKEGSHHEGEPLPAGRQGVPFVHGTVVDFNAFCERFFRLADLDLYSIREKNKNKVQVYDISLARQKEYRVVFVAGLLEKKFPVQMKEDPLLGDWERSVFNNIKVPGTVHGTLQERLSRQPMERYLFYLAVTRANEKLILTYPRLNLEGKESLPSYYVDEVVRLFDGGVTYRRQNLSRPYPALPDAVNERELELALMGALWTPERDGVNPEPLMLYVTNELLKRPESQLKLKRAFHEIKDELSGGEIQALDPFKPSLTSPSRLEEYGKCSFHYYAHQVLKLNDPEEDPNITMRGIILHKVLEDMMTKWLEPKKSGSMSAENLRNLKLNKKRAIHEALDYLHEVLHDHRILTEKKYQYDLEIAGMEEMLELFLEVEIDRLAAAQMHPAYFEYDFGVENKEAGPLTLEFEGRTVQIRGKIDRIDVDPEGKLASVLDYKRTAMFSKSSLDMGTSLQLPIYSLVAERQLGYEVISAELYSLRERAKKGFYREEYKGYFEKKRSQLLLKKEEYAALMKQSIDYIERYTQAMMELKMEARPRDPKLCQSFCAYGPVCRIQKWKLPMILEEIKNSDQSLGSSDSKEKTNDQSQATSDQSLATEPK